MRPFITALLLLPALAAPSLPADVDYNRDIHAIFAARCIVCHGEVKRSGGLSLATYDDILAGGRTGAAVKPGASGDSLLVRRIDGRTGPRMPMGGDPLSAAEVATIASWIDLGARKSPEGPAATARWEPQLTLIAPAVPPAVWAGWTSPVDRFTARYLSHRGGKPATVTDAEFARRAYLDIQGLLPDPEALRAFVADANPAKRARLAEALLSDSAKYTDHWISYWNDLLRNDEGVQYYSETAGRKSITPWLLDALRTNKPYDAMMRQLLNPTGPGDPDGFLIGVNWRGAVSASQTPAMQASQNTAQIFLGINFKCNSCHDSFISRWKLADAYRLAAYFSAEPKLQLYRCDVAQPGRFAEAGFMYPELDGRPGSDSVADRRAAIAAIFTDRRNGRVARTLVNRIWARLMGRGLVENVDDMDGEPWSPELLDWLASDFVSHGYDLKRLIATIVSSRTYQLPSVPAKDAGPKEYSFRGPEWRRLTAEQFADAVAAVTGDWRVAPPKPANANPPAPPATGVVAAFSGQPVDAAGVAPRPATPAPAPAPKPLGDPPQLQGGDYTREWRIAASALSRALGRPIRDQVFTTRETLPTTIQALELVNGETLTHWLERGARKMLGELPPEPKSLFSRQVNSPGRGGVVVTPPFSVDLSGAEKIWLIVEDSLSTAPDKAAPIWLDAAFSGPSGKTPLSQLKPIDSQGLRDSGGSPAVDNAVRVKFPSALVYDVAGKGFTRFEGVPTTENVALGQGETVNARFFVFDKQPSMDRLAPPNPGTPLPAGPVPTTIPQTVDRVYGYLLGRAPLPAERRVASAALTDPAHPGRPSAQGLADLLWSVLMSPEFQFIR